MKDSTFRDLQTLERYAKAARREIRAGNVVGAANTAAAISTLSSRVQHELKRRATHRLAS